MDTEAVRSLGKCRGVYRESRVRIWIFIIGMLMFISSVGLLLRFDAESETPRMLTGWVVLQITLPMIISMILIWYLASRFFPYKKLMIYDGGLQFVSKGGTRTYLWRDFAIINRRIVKYTNSKKENHWYEFRLKSGLRAFELASSKYPGLETGSLSAILKRAHLEGFINLITEIDWVEPDNYSAG